MLLCRIEGVMKSGSPGQEAMEGALCAVQSLWVLIDHPVSPEAFGR